VIARAAHAAGDALGIYCARDRDDERTKACAALGCEKHFELGFDPDAAQAVQGEKVGKLVQVNLEPAFNIPSGDRTV